MASTGVPERARRGSCSAVNALLLPSRWRTSMRHRGGLCNSSRCARSSVVPGGMSACGSWTRSAETSCARRAEAFGEQGLQLSLELSAVVLVVLLAGPGLKRPPAFHYGEQMRGIRARCGANGPFRCIALVAVALFVWPFAGALSGAETTSALRVELPGAPQRVFGSDGREHIEYDLIITNAFTADATLSSLEVRGGGRRLLSLRGAALGAVTLQLTSSKPSDGRIGPASTVVTQVDIALPRAGRRTVPALLTNRIRYRIPANAPSRPIIGTTTIAMPAVRVDRRAPVVIASPLRGTGWITANGCCDDPTSPHRQTVLGTSNGSYVMPETFAVDWVRVAGGRLFTGDGSKNSDWRAYGSPIYAVAAGTVVSARNNLPDIPPRARNLELRTPRDFGGNSVILKIGPGRYACYAHLVRGSVRVRRAQHVRLGQRIGLLGNSGNTDAPHLHFGIQSRPDCLSKNDPFEIDRYTLEGIVGPSSAPPVIDVVGPPRSQIRSHPLIRSVSTFFGPASPR